MRRLVLYVALALLSAVLMATLWIGWVFVTAPSRPPSDRATHLARGIAEGLNCSALVGLVGLLAAVGLAIVRARR